MLVGSVPVAPEGPGVLIEPEGSKNPRLVHAEDEERGRAREAPASKVGGPARDGARWEAWETG